MGGDYFVEMVRYDERDTMASKLERGELERNDVASVAHVLAKFHARTRRVAASGSAALAVDRRFQRNLYELVACVEQRGETGRALAPERVAHAFVESHAVRLQSRANRGVVRERHGDLRAEHVVVDQDVESSSSPERLRSLPQPQFGLARLRARPPVP